MLVVPCGLVLEVALEVDDVDKVVLGLVVLFAVLTVLVVKGLDVELETVFEVVDILCELVEGDVWVVDVEVELVTLEVVVEEAV